MYRFLLTPRWMGINVFAVLAIPVCVFMGIWQLSRFESRVDAQRAADHQPDPAKEPASPLDRLLPVTQQSSGRQAEVSGHYADQYIVPERMLDGRTGSYVLTMLRTDDGKALPVVRGWLARGKKAPAVPAGEVHIVGSLQPSETTDSDGVIANGSLPQGEVGMISAASLVNIVPYGVYNGWVTVNKGTDGLRPVPAAAPENTGLDLKAFQNLGYTGEWFVFAGFVIYMWLRLVRREAESERDRSLGIETAA